MEQTQRRLYQLVEARHGRFLANPNDIYIGRALLDYGEFSELEFEFIRSYLSPGDHLVEVGANIGALTVPLAKHLGRHSQLTIIEPQPLIFQTLCANLALNDIENARCFNLLCGSGPGLANLPQLNYHRMGNFGGISFANASAEGSSEKIEIRALDAFEITRLDLLKIDAEGMELEILQGANTLITRHKPILYVENDRQEKSAALIRLIQNLGYRLWWHLPPMFNPNNFTGNRFNPWPRILSFNMFCLPKDSQHLSPNWDEITDPTYHPLGKT